jgi:hypothetical protein
LKAKNSEGPASAANVNDGAWLSLGHWGVASPSGGFVRVGPVTLQLFMTVFIRLKARFLRAKWHVSAKEPGNLQETTAFIHGTPAKASSILLTSDMDK